MRTSLACALALAAGLSTMNIAASRAKGSQSLKVWLAPSGADLDAWGKAAYKVSRRSSRLQIETHHLSPGAHNVLVGGVLVGTLMMPAGSGGGKPARFVLDTRTAGSAAVDPRHKSIQIVDGTSGMVELEVEQFPADKSSEMQRTEIEVPFENLGPQPAAQGSAEFKEFQGRRKFEVKADGLAPGVYDLLVGDVAQAQLTVGLDGEGKAEFDSLPHDARADDEDGVADDHQGNDHATGHGDDHGDGQGDSHGDDHGDGHGADDHQGDGDTKLLLSFDPRGQQIEIALGADVILKIASFPGH